MNADLQKESTGLRISTDEEGQEAPKLYRSHRGNPLRHLQGFTLGDALRATDRSLGMEPGVEYLILGYWFSEAYGLYAYIGETPNAMMEHYRFANEEKATDEVLFSRLPRVITEVCIQDCLHALEYVPALAPQAKMWPAKKEPIDNVVPLHDEKGQYSLFNVA